MEPGRHNMGSLPLVAQRRIWDVLDQGEAFRDNLVLTYWGALAVCPHRPVQVFCEHVTHSDDRSVGALASPS